MGFLGQTSFSIFIWQNLFMGLGAGMATAMPESKSLSFWFAVIGLTKPIAKRLRSKMVTTC